MSRTYAIELILTRRHYSIVGNAKHRPHAGLVQAWRSRERFVREVQSVPGFDPDRLMAGQLRLIRIGNRLFGPRNCLWAPIGSGTISGRPLIRVTRSRSVSAVVHNLHYAEQIGVSTTTLRRMADRQQRLGGARYDWHQFTCEELQALAAQNRIIY